ncbi:microneme-like protein [Toxoplasma gondii CAST]|uniref:Microneme-like protein n=1 Tax=Toxoplasma gondii CAST TaxID=943122 RepID=A0A425HSW0_TOXGO|nr:microneme-like protein [Toxoplasma gondii CAST]
MCLLSSLFSPSSVSASLVSVSPFLRSLLPQSFVCLLSYPALGLIHSVSASELDTALVSVPTSKAVSFTEFDIQQPPSDNSWLCRFSFWDGPCVDRQHNGIGPWRFCPSGSCCSKVKCAYGSCGGSWCAAWNSGLCVFHNGDYESDRCTCEKYGGQCSKNGSCKRLDTPEGGAFCYCNPGYVGDGRTCESDPCYGSPCAPGTCSRMGNSYVCGCPPGYTQDTSRGHARCVEKADSCRAQPCGSDTVAYDCVSFDSGAYECICKDGYASNGTKCEKQDWCKDNPCGDANAVYDCISHETGYTCQCQKGYIQVVTDEGQQKCAKNPCSYDPCGTSDLVKECINKGDGTYGCVCADIAEITTHEESNQITCARKDPCLGNPCGAAEAVQQCFVDGPTYGCVCASGYTVVPDATGAKKCVFGDPCQLGSCGPDEAVDSCSTNGQAYTCQCTPEAILSTSANGIQSCVMRDECEENCGATEGVTRCEKISEDKWDCLCKAGYMLKYVKGKKMCHKADACSVNPCGTAQAVADCQVDVGGDGYTCVCNSGYELRTQSDNTQLCAPPNSCIGDPCGKAEAVSMCLPTKDGYTCKCNANYTLQTMYGKPRCVPGPSSYESDEEETSSSSSTTSEEEGTSTVMIAGCVIGGVVLLGAVAYMGRRGNDEEEDEQPRPPAGGPQGPYMGQQGYGQGQNLMPPGMDPAMGRNSMMARQQYAMDTRNSFWG